jgi:hypothetical protein
MFDLMAAVDEERERSEEDSADSADSAEKQQSCGIAAADTGRSVADKPEQAHQSAVVRIYPQTPEAPESADLEVCSQLPANPQNPQGKRSQSGKGQGWQAAHDEFIAHIMKCRACHAPKNRYCDFGAQCRASYRLAFREAQ